MRALAAVVLAMLLPGCLGEISEELWGVSHPEALLRAEPYDALVVHVTYQAGAEPTPSALEHAVDVLRAVTDKKEILVEGPTLATASTEVRGVARDGKALLAIQYRTGTMTMGDNRSAAGVYLGDMIWMFPDSWRQLGGLLALGNGAAAETIEAEVLAHEIGHALGLVGHGIPMTRDRLHADDPCQCHSANEQSLMYPNVHDIQQHALHIMQSGRVAPMTFDADDRADLAAYREGRTGPPLR